MGNNSIGLSVKKSAKQQEKLVWMYSAYLNNN